MCFAVNKHKAHSAPKASLTSLSSPTHANPLSMKGHLFYLLMVLNGWLAQGQSLHLLLVSDTHDPSIGAGCAVNHSRMSKQLERIAGDVALAFHLISLTGDQVLKSAVFDQIDSLEVEAEDVIWFHFSGHGINDDLSPWPTLLIDGEGPKMALKNIHNQLLTKKAKLVLTTADCCNRSIPIQNQAIKYPEHIAEKGLIHDTKNSPHYCSLFRKSKGHILASGSKKGGYSKYSSPLGGYFTLSLCESLYAVGQSPSSSPRDWSAVLQQTAKSTYESTAAIDQVQVPQFKVSLEAERPNIVYSKDTAIYYEVQPEDNIKQIAERFGVSIQQIYEWNKIKIKNINVIYPGTILKVGE